MWMKWLSKLHSKPPLLEVINVTDILRLRRRECVSHYPLCHGLSDAATYEARRAGEEGESQAAPLPFCVLVASKKKTNRQPAHPLLPWETDTSPRIAGTLYCSCSHHVSAVDA